MHIAYLVNQYPKVSHTFIRREILALERRGLRVTRYALRGWDEAVVDARDTRERSVTRYLLQGGATALLAAVAATALGRPRRFARALALAFRMGRRADRPLPVHLVYLAEACLLARWMGKAGVTHLHAHFGTNPAEIAMLAAGLVALPWSFTVHGPEEFDKPAFIGLGEKIVRSTFVAAISSFGRSQLFRSVDHGHWDKVEVVHCGLDAESFVTGDTAGPGSGVASSRLVCVGRLCEQKGQLLLVEAASRLAASGIPFELVLAGDGEMRPELEAAIARADLGERITITGWIDSDAVREHILASRALVLPSFAEGLPVAIMEAMAAGRPVVSTYVAGIPELLVPKIHGWLAPAGNVDALVEAMADCLRASPEVIARMGAAARDRVAERHDIDTEAGKLAYLFSRPPAASAASSALAAPANPSPSPP